LKEGILKLFWYTAVRLSWYRSNAPWMFPWAYRTERGDFAVVLIYCHETILVQVKCSLDLPLAILQLFWYTVVRLSWGVNIYPANMIFPICASHYVMKLFLHLSSHYKIIIFQLPIIFKISCHGKPTKWWGFCKSLRIFFTDFWYRSNAPWGVNFYLLPVIFIIFPICASCCIMTL